MSNQKEQAEYLCWRVNTRGLIREVFNNPGTEALSIPFNMFIRLLIMVAERASEINDDKLNALMCRLALYEQSDPYSEHYDAEMTDLAIRKGSHQNNKGEKRVKSKTNRSSFRMGNPGND